MTTTKITRATLKSLIESKTRWTHEHKHGNLRFRFGRFGFKNIAMIDGQYHNGSEAFEVYAGTPNDCQATWEAINYLAPTT